jgi:ADP-heptose:LPS heptosyltransferase
VALDVVTLRALGLGDLLTAVPAMRALARAMPEHRHVLAVPPVLAPLVSLIGATDAIIPAEALQPLIGVDAPAVAVNLHGRGPESHRVLERLHPERLIAFASRAAGHDGPQWRRDEHEVLRWCRLLEESGIPADPTDLEIATPAQAAPAAARGAVVIHPGAASGARRWPASRWGEVAWHLREEGLTVVVTGGTAEVPIAEAVAQVAGLDQDCVLAGQTDVIGLAAVVAGAQAVLCGDTGVAHLATALRTPSVVLFGPVPPALWGPPPDRPWNQALWAGSTGDPHANQADPGLLRISVEDVVRACRSLRTPVAA